MSEISVPFVALDRQYLAYKSEIDEAFERVALSGVYVMGPDVLEFEKELAALCNTKYAIAVANGTDALILSLRALGIGDGDEVITAPNSFIASAGAVIALGATPTFCDVGEDHNMDPAKLEAAITEKTKAIMPVHLTGRPAPMDEINAIAKKHGLYVIEDSAQAIDAKYKGRPVGSLGDMGCFSLHPLKNLFVMGDGGFITLSNEDHYHAIKRIQNHGLINRNECGEWGMNSRLDTVLAAMGRVKLGHMSQITARFREIAGLYREGLKDFVTVPVDSPDEFAVYHNFVILTDHRDALQSYLQKHNIGCAIHYPIPLHLQKSAKNLGYKEGDFPVSERLNKQQLSLPIFPEIKQEEIDTVINAIKTFFETMKED